MNLPTRNQKLLLVFVILTAWSLSKGNAQLLQNGSFEDYPSGGSPVFTLAPPTGWNAAVALPYWIPANSPDFSAQPEDGSAYIGMQISAGTTSILFQTMTGLDAGQTYNLTYYVQANNADAATGNFGVLVSGASNVSGDVNVNPVVGTWTEEAESFTATASQESLNLEWTPAVDGAIVLVDNVSISEAPEPSTWALLLMGVTGVAMVHRFKKLSV